MGAGHLRADTDPPCARKGVQQMASAELDEFRVRFANLRGELEERRK